MPQEGCGTVDAQFNATPQRELFFFKGTYGLKYLFTFKAFWLKHIQDLFFSRFYVTCFWESIDAMQLQGKGVLGTLWLVSTVLEQGQTLELKK